MLVIRALENKKITRWILIKRYFYELFFKSIGMEMKLWWCEDSTSKNTKNAPKNDNEFAFSFNEILAKERVQECNSF